MWRIVLILPLALSTLAIRVPVDSKEDNVKNSTPNKKSANKKQDSFYIPDPANVDSYLVPPDPHRLEDAVFDDIVTPATYLLPPSPEKQFDYYIPTETGQQSDWYPIAQLPLQSTPIEVITQRPAEVTPIIVSDDHSFDLVQKQNPRDGKSYGGERFIIPLPSRHLQPPIENASSDYTLSSPSGELELPVEEINQKYKEPPSSPTEYQYLAKVSNRKYPKNNVIRFKAPERTIALHLTPPPKPLISKYKTPTKLYPKKFNGGFKPVPIPIGQFAGEPSQGVIQAKPLKPYKPAASDESDYFEPDDQKKHYLYEQAQQNRKRKEEYESQQQQSAEAEDTRADNAPAEPLTSETSFEHPTRNTNPAYLRQAPQASPAPQTPQPKKPTVPKPPPDGERTEFRMHGMKGPQSYQFGYDTGKGKNRQFRYEERDNDGRVKGHYGYMDKDGKMRVVNYDADPEKGFHAEAPQEAEPEA